MDRTSVITASVFAGIGTIFTIVAFSASSAVAKWIFGILAVLVFGFTIYGTIDAIVKSRRKPKNLADLLIQALKESVDSPDFAQRMQNAGERRDKLFKGQRTEDTDYGYSPENPIMTSTISSSDDYLRKLRTTDKKSFTWKRIGSFSMQEVHGVENVIVDGYLLYLDGEEYKEIYICPYGHTSVSAPQGLLLAE